MRTFSMAMLILAALSTACNGAPPGEASEAGTDQPNVPPSPSTKISLATPNVVMLADPPPPFTYWAPENSTVKNHPHQPGIWIADGPDRSRKYYFGDQCKASEYQALVGHTISELPDRPEGATWRLKCSTCPVTSDLRPNRLNVSYDEVTKIIDDISCS